ncbi:MAG: hypothetical protein D6765_01900 [Bacteroidetes bacterium]|nr:MAG: hypothetical protein D6765_01900 [Bacteroidota bacterium]
MDAHPRMKRIAWTLPLVFFLVALLLGVGLEGEFPLNDDWRYAYPVKTWLKEGLPRPAVPFAPTLLLQVGWGALFCWVGGGFSFLSLRGSTLVAALLALWLFGRLSRRLGASEAGALLAGLTLAFNPLFFSLTPTFMTDVPFLAILLAGFWFALCYLENGRLLSLTFAILAGVAAFLIRQPGILLLPALAGVLLMRSPRRFQTLVTAGALLLLTAGVLLGFEWLKESTPALQAFYVPADEQYLKLLFAQPLPFAETLLKRALKSAIYLGLFAWPLLPLMDWRPRWGWAVSGLGGAALLTGALVAAGYVFPFGGNVLFNFGLGPELLTDVYTLELPNTPALPSWAMVGLQWAGTVGAFGLLGLVPHWWRQATPLQQRAGLFLLAFSLLYLPLMSVTSFFDRYLLPLIAAVLLLMSPRLRWKGLPALLPLIAFGWFSLAATHDYLSWNRARLQAFQWCARQGIGIQELDAGYELNGWLNHERGKAPAPGRSFWWVSDDRYLISFGPVPGRELVHRVPYRRRLFPGMDTLLVSRRIE